MIYWGTSLLLVENVHFANKIYLDIAIDHRQKCRTAHGSGDEAKGNCLGWSANPICTQGRFQSRYVPKNVLLLVDIFIFSTDIINLQNVGDKAPLRSNLVSSLTGGMCLLLFPDFSINWLHSVFILTLCCL